jgi:hypothetical protein
LAEPFQGVARLPTVVETLQTASANGRLTAAC